MPIATLDQVKAKLGADAPADADLESVLRAAEARAIRRTRLSLAIEARVEYFEGVRAGDVLYLARRPIDTAIALVVDGRNFGATTWTALNADVVSAAEGRVRFLAGDLTSWPPEPGHPVWTRWRVPPWPVVRIGYTTALAEVSDELSDGVAALAAFLVSPGSWSGLTSATAGPVSESYGTGQGAIPAGLWARIDTAAGVAAVPRVTR